MSQNKYTKEREEFEKINSNGRLGAYLNTVIADLEVDNKGQYFRDLFGKYDVELWQFIQNLLEKREEEIVKNLEKGGRIISVADIKFMYKDLSRPKEE